MARRVLFLLMLFVGVAQSASAQTPQATSPSANAQDKNSKDVHVVLEIRWLVLSDNLIQCLGPALKKLPAMGSHAVYDKQQIERLLLAARGDRSSDEGPNQTVPAKNGEKGELSLLRHGRTIETTMLAAVSEDRQAIEIQLTWPKGEDGKEILPVTTATVPTGSSLLIQTHVLIGSIAMPPASPLQKLEDRLLNRKRPAAVRDVQQGFLLLTPRIALPGEKENQPAAK